MTTVVILQSNYVPWRGYFDLIRRADDFVLYDNVQFTKRDWRNRNRIVGPHGPQWLTIPVETTGRYEQTIEETRVADGRWARKHRTAIQGALARGPEYARLKPLLDAWFDAAGGEERLVKINHIFIRGIMDLLGLKTRLHEAKDIGASGGQTDRLVDICRRLGASRYLSGPAARNYLDEQRFRAAGIAVEWMEYPEYPRYPQADGGYDPGVSILDSLAWMAPATVLDGDRA